MTTSPARATGTLEPPPLLTSGQAHVEANRCLMCWDAPCTRACPTHIDVPGFIKRIAFGDDLGAAQLIFSANPLGDSCAHACPTEVLCEGACVMHGRGERPIDIAKLQGYATAPVIHGGVPMFTPAHKNGHQVAIVGAGPAGLGCAAELLKRGHHVEVFEADHEPGGLVSHGVAEYKVARSAAVSEIGWLQGQGVVIHTSTPVGHNHLPVEELLSDFDAVFVGIGLGDIAPLGIEGEGIETVWDALDLIATFKKGELPPDYCQGKRVAVLGGGNTAIDAARLTARLGAEVVLVYRRGEEHMPAYRHEIDEAKADGVELLTWAAPEAIVETGDLVLRWRQTEPGKPGPDGRPAVVSTDHAEDLAVDLVVVATGQQTRANWLSDLMEIDAKGKVVVDDDQHTSHPKIWAGGDCVSGGQEVVNAVAEGVAAARSIDQTLKAR